jgi:hypothetical protein
MLMPDQIDRLAKEMSEWRGAGSRDWAIALQAVADEHPSFTLADLREVANQWWVDEAARNGVFRNHRDHRPIERLIFDAIREYQRGRLLVAALYVNQWGA